MAVGAQAPYGGAAIALPGAWEAERYDLGGAGVAYHDTTAGNSGGALRADDVDVAADTTASGGHAVINAAVGEWLEFTTDAAFSTERPFANLEITYQANYAKRLRVLQDGAVLAEPVLPKPASGWATLVLEKVPVVSATGSVIRVEVVESASNALLSDKVSAGATEQWDVIDAGDGWIALRSVSSGRFFRVTSKDHPIYAASETIVGNQEKLEWVAVSAGIVGIRSVNTNTYLSAGSTTATVGIKATSVAGTREQFSVDDLGAAPGVAAGAYPVGRRVALRGVHVNRYLSVADDPSLKLDALALTQWVNRLPVLSVGQDWTIAWPASGLTLTGTARELDPSGSLVDQEWIQVAGPSVATLGAQTTTTDAQGVATTSVPVSGVGRGVYVFEFYAVDNEGDRAAQRVSVAVIDEAQHTLVTPTDSRIQYHGRVHNAGGNAPLFGWSSAGFVVRFSGTSISLKMSAGGWPSSKQTLLAIIDGDEANARIIDMSRNSPVAHVASELADTEHTVRIFAMNGAWVAPTTFNGILLGSGATLLDPPARPTRRIEFYGDSITEGSFLDGEPFTNTYKAYAAQTALRLGAEMSVIAKSGLGLVKTQYSGGHTLEAIAWRGLPHDSTSVWNPDRWIPQVVVVNIGQNDKWLQGTTPDQTFVDEYVDFLRQLRARRPYAHVICALGSMDATEPGSKWPGIVQAAMDVVKTEDNDSRLHTHFFTYLGAGTGHPQPAQAAAMADELAAKINALAGGDVWTAGKAPPAGYRSWATTHFELPHADYAMPQADANSDGETNLLKYAAGLDPWDSMLRATPHVEPAATGDGGWRFVFRAWAADLEYAVMHSTTLAEMDWSPTPWPAVDEGDGWRAVTVPAGSGPRRFLRLVVSVPSS